MSHLQLLYLFCEVGSCVQLRIVLHLCSSLASLMLALQAYTTIAGLNIVFYTRVTGYSSSPTPTSLSSVSPTPHPPLCSAAKFGGFRFLTQLPLYLQVLHLGFSQPWIGNIQRGKMPEFQNQNLDLLLTKLFTQVVLQQWCVGCWSLPPVDIGSSVSST